MNAPTWKNLLGDRIPADWGREIDTFETQTTLRKQGKVEEKVFAENRLRRGAYGQRYDNGQRNDGTGTKTLPYDSQLTKGPETLFDAPGMQRIKIPFGGMNPDQMEVLADLCEEYSDNICHVTTRQDFQLHYIHIEDTPAIMRRLAAVGMTSREACGNSVRNVTACPLAGVCNTQAFDVTPYADALMWFMLGHPDTMEFGRKFKPAFSGCKDEACGLVQMHDIGYVAKIQDVDGVPTRGFEVVVGGGLGAVPFQAKVLSEFTTMDEILPQMQAVSRVFGRLGEKKNRQKARVKFVVQKLGIDEFRRLVEEERKILPYDPRWTAYLADVDKFEESPLKKAETLQIGGVLPEGFLKWQKTNVYKQRQPGYVTVTVALPLGDLTARQLRKLADISRTYCRESVRTTVEQNIVIRWISEGDLINVYKDLQSAKLAEAGAGTVVDLVSCPGTDTCKLGISASRGLAGELRTRLLAKGDNIDPAIAALRIKVSGCFNSCGQHHVSDLGFYGVSRNKDGYTVPHFQVIIGGQWTENGGSYGLAIGAIPAKRIPLVVDRVTGRFVSDRETDESFQAYCKRIGKAELKAMLEDLVPIPSHDEDPSLYTDWGDAREYTIGDIGVGECAGEVVSPAEFALTASERQVFEAQLELDKGEYNTGAKRAYESMVEAARGLLLQIRVEVPNEPDAIVAAFKTHFFDTEVFFDPFRGGSIAQYFFNASDAIKAGTTWTEEKVHMLVEEASLFLEGSHSCYARLLSSASAK